LDELEQVVRDALDAAAGHADGAGLIAGIRERAARRRHRRRLLWIAATVGTVGLMLATAEVVASITGSPVPTISTSTGGGLGNPSDAPLCWATDAVDRLSMRRTDAFPGNHVRYVAPATAVVDEVAAVREVAVALCRLPVSLDALAFCAADLGVAYHLTFTGKGKTFPEVSVHLTGCALVTGVGKTRWGSDPVWVALGKALHLRPPYAEAFRGELPTG